MKLDDLPPSLRRRLEKELEPGERVMWITRPGTSSLWGGPSPCLKLSVAMFLFTGLTIPGGLSHGWGRWVVVGSAGLAAALLFAFLCSLGPGRPIYAVTDRRAILLIFGLGGGFYYWYPEDLAMRRALTNADGSGDVIFGQEFDSADDQEGTWRQRHIRRQLGQPRRFDCAWYGVPNVGEAETYLAALQLHGSRGGKA